MSPTKSYMGKFIGEVMDVSDPDKRCRVRVHVYDLFDGVPTDDLPWAVFVLPFGARVGEGIVCPVQVGDTVWVEFIGGDTRRPIVVGAALAMPSGIPSLPPELYQGAGQVTHERTSDEPSVSSPPYFEDVVLRQNNALIQLCRSGNIRITQIDSKSAVELCPDGTVVIHAAKQLLCSAPEKILLKVNSTHMTMQPDSILCEVGGSTINMVPKTISIASTNVNISGLLSCTTIGGSSMTMTDSQIVMDAPNVRVNEDR